ncbi:MAG: heme-copper oxidase subunit III [Acidobacteria bacterium]|nr:heme-copper oxidase subunit III [Acidobacteriota bacterium]
MAQGSAARSGAARGLPSGAAGAPATAFGGGPPSPPRSGIASTRIAIVMLLGAETMFFTGLIGAYVVLRGASTAWPPIGLPRLPIAVTWANTLVLVTSCVTMAMSLSALKRKSPWRLERYLTLTTLLGMFFLAVQGSEWIRLVRHGLTVSTGVYGATFYTLIGVHGLHVLGAVLWLLWVQQRARRTRYSGANAAAIDMVSIYWFYVGGLWLILFPLVYLY